MLEVVVEPAERVEILVAMLRDREVERVLRLEQDLSGADLEDVEDLARSLAGQQQAAQGFLMVRLVSMEHDLEERRRLVLRQRHRVAQDCSLLRRAAAVGDCRYLLLLDVVGDAVARHLVGRVPARADADVERAGVDHVMGIVPADEIAELDRGPGAEGFVAGGVGAVEVDAVLHVDEPGKDELRQGLLAMRRLLHDAEEDAIGLEHVAAMNQVSQ